MQNSETCYAVRLARLPANPTPTHASFALTLLVYSFAYVNREAMNGPEKHRLITS